MPFSTCSAVTSTSVSTKSGRPSARMHALTTTTGCLPLGFDIAISFKRGGNKNRAWDDTVTSRVAWDRADLAAGTRGGSRWVGGRRVVPCRGTSFLVGSHGPVKDLAGLL